MELLPVPPALPARIVCILTEILLKSASLGTTTMERLSDASLVLP